MTYLKVKIHSHMIIPDFDDFVPSSSQMLTSWTNANSRDFSTMKICYLAVVKKRKSFKITGKLNSVALKCYV